MDDIGDRTLPGRPGDAAQTAPADAGIALLRCPHCGGRLIQTSIGTIICAACNTPIATHDGIVDFVAGASVTELDNIDYDAFYHVSHEAALNLYQVIRAAAGPLWPASLGDGLEIGCGTGGFTTAILSECSADRVVLTDISLKMLGICRMRLDGAPARGLTFATYSGTEDCFEPNAFDTCYGTAVLHHVIDVPHIIGNIHRLLKPGGRAFFMEPNLPFHRALTQTLAGILADWIRDQTVPEPDISRMLNWMGEVHCNIVNSGDIEILSGREDKHLFVGSEFEAMAEAAGFHSASALPCGLDPTGIHTIGIYLEQGGVSDTTMALLRKVWPAAQDAYFTGLRPQDRAPSYLFWLLKVARKGAARKAEASVLNPDAKAAAEKFRLWLRLAVDRDNPGLGLVVDGWCVAQGRVKSVQLTTGELSAKVPVWRPRPDVQVAINGDNTYPPLHALCSGIEGRVSLGKADAEPVEVHVDLVITDNRLVPVGTVMVPPSGDIVVLEV